MAQQSITLEPGESKVVLFEATPTEVRTYLVSVDGLTGSFETYIYLPKFKIGDHVAYFVGAGTEDIFEITALVFLPPPSYGVYTMQVVSAVTGMYTLGQIVRFYFSDADVTMIKV